MSSKKMQNCKGVRKKIMGNFKPSLRSQACKTLSIARRSFSIFKEDNGVCHLVEVFA